MSPARRDRLVSSAGVIVGLVILVLALTGQAAPEMAGVGSLLALVCAWALHEIRPRKRR